MKKFFSKAGKILLYFTFSVVLIGLVGSVAYNFYLRAQVSELNSIYQDAQQDLSQGNVTIEDLHAEFDRLNDEVNALTAEKEELQSKIDTLQIEGMGTISGEIFPLITSTEGGFNQYQRVCARQATNKNVMYCATVSATQGDFSLILSPGTYEVFAELFIHATADESAFEAKAFYSEYVKCTQEKENDAECNAEKGTTPIEIEVKAGETLENVDPIHWQ